MSDVTVTEQVRIEWRQGRRGRWQVWRGCRTRDAAATIIERELARMEADGVPAGEFRVVVRQVRTTPWRAVPK